MNRTARILLAAIAAGAVAGCGGQSGSSPPAASAAPTAVSGVAALGTPVDAVVVMDASTPSRQSVAEVRADGSFSADVSGLTPPFLVKAVPVSPSMDAQYAIAQGAGRANVNPVTTLAILGASGARGTAALATSAGLKNVAGGFDGVLAQLADVLEPLLAQYGITDLSSLDGALTLDALLGDVRFSVHGDTLIVTDAATNQIIYQGSLLDLGAGVFDSSSLPSATPGGAPIAATDGATLYAQKCESCHGALATSELRGRSASDLQAAHSGKLTSAQADAVAAALGGGASSSGDSGGSSGSSGSGSSSSSGAALLDGVALYDRYCGSCHGAISGSSVAGKTLEQVLLFMSAGLSVDKLQAIVGAVNAAAGQGSGGSSSGSASSGSSGNSGSGIDGASIYGQRCASCHGDLSSSGVRGATAAAIQAKHPGKLSSPEAGAVAQALSSAASGGSAGNCGALDGVALYNKYCAMCHGGAISRSSLQGVLLDQVSRFMSLGLGKLQLQAIIDVLNGTSSTSCPAAGSP